jgi:hypothetical protein
MISAFFSQFRLGEFIGPPQFAELRANNILLCLRHRP